MHVDAEYLSVNLGPDWKDRQKAAGRPLPHPIPTHTHTHTHTHTRELQHTEIGWGGAEWEYREDASYSGAGVQVGLPGGGGTWAEAQRLQL